jgi:hypothetical protein
MPAFHLWTPPSGQGKTLNALQQECAWPSVDVISDRIQKLKEVADLQTEVENGPSEGQLDDVIEKLEHVIEFKRR